MKKGMSRFGAVALAATLSATLPATNAVAANGGTTASTSALRVPTLSWQACDGATDFQCATATVPLDYDHPNGQQIEIAVIRHPATDPSHRIGSLFFNPGGPGHAGIAELPLYYPKFPAEIRSDFDIVSFDPRGIGESTPVRCLPTADDEAALLAKAPVGLPVGAAEQKAWIDTYAQWDRDCGAASGDLLAHLSTANVARDMDLLRQAVGDPTMNYFGPSYGTYLGATYANLFPTKVRAMELESNVNPAAWVDQVGGAVAGTFLRQGSDEGSAQTLNYFLTKCGAVSTDQCAFSAGTPSATVAKYGALLDALRATPVVLDGTTYTYAYTAAFVVSMLYLTPPVPAIGAPGYSGLAAILQQLYTAATGQTASGSSGSSAVTSAPVTSAPAPAAPSSGLGSSSASTLAAPSALGGQYGALCADSPNPRNAYSYVAQSDLAMRRSGASGAVWTWLAEPCATWPVRADADRYTGPFDRPTSATILVVGITNDPATPYKSSVAMARQLARSRMLTVQGSGHEVLFNTSTCANDYAAAYFVHGTLPAVGTTCAQDQPPF